MGASRPTLRARRKDDSVFPVDIALSPVPLDGRTYTIAVARDMTERVAMAEQIRRIQKLEAIGQLSSGIAHDFNNVLALVLSSADLLRQRAGMSAEAHAAIKRIDSACKLGMSLTRRLMSLARQQQQDPEAVDIRKRMADVVEVLRRTLSDRIVVSECYTGDVWPCWVDAAQLENAILNLAFNARDAMPLGGRLVFRLANRRIDDLEAANGLRISPGDYVSIELEDTGEGITPEIARRAFEPFFTTKPTEKGTGLGLAMVYSFAVQSKGAVRLEALSGGGCKAEILLPRYVASAHTGKDALSAQRSKSDTVLVVDDDSTLLLAVAEMLTASGLYPVKADSISDAMDKLAARDDISIILTDLLLANGESGYDLAQQALQYSPELHIVCMSGFSDEFVVPQNLTGRIHMLRKPFDRRELLSVFPARALST